MPDILRSVAGEIAMGASVAALLIPGVDVVDLGVVAGISVNGAVSLTANAVAIGTGALSSGEDFSKGEYVTGVLDGLGSLAGLGALHMAGIANLERMAAESASNAAVRSWLVENASTLAKDARLSSFGAFGLSFLTALLAGTAGASHCR